MTQEQRDLSVAATLAPLLKHPEGAHYVLAEIHDYLDPAHVAPDEQPKWTEDLL